MKLLLTAAFCVMTMICFSQSIITGICKNNKGEPVPYASITILNPENNKIIAFKAADAEGNYMVSFQTMLPKVLIRFSLINFLPVIKTIENRTQTVDFIVIEKITTLKNIMVKPPMVYQKGDTIVHDVQQYANTNDRTLSDVIKKMPGVEVDESGKIKYQGKDINQFNVEGKDLMQGQYGIIPNSIPYNDVSKFEIIQNNQPVKMLKGKVPSDAAGVNIKLKKAVTYTGTGSVGLGAAPFLWSAKITPMLLSKKEQALVSFKSNNTGEDVSSDLNTILLTSGFEGYSRDVLTGGLLNTSMVNPPSQIDKQRYWFNRSHAVSANILIPLKKDWELKSNSMFLDNDLKLTGNLQTSVTSVDNNGNATIINYKRAATDEAHHQKLKTTLTLNRNNEKNFFRNSLIFTTDKDHDKTDLFINNLPAYQHTRANGYSIQNSLSSLFSLDKKKKYTANIQSYFNFISDPQLYRIDSLHGLEFPEPDMQNALSFIQNETLHTITANNTFSLGFTKWKWNMMPAVLINYSQNRLSSDMETINPPLVEKYSYPWKNNLHFRELKTSVDYRIYRQTEKWSVSIDIPFSAVVLKALDKADSFNNALRKNVLEPSTYVQYILNNKFKVTASAGRQYLFADIQGVYPGFIFSSLNFNANNGPIAVKQNRYLASKLIYKNILDNVDASIGYSFSQTLSNVILSREISNSGQEVLSAKELDNSSNNNSVRLGVSKYFTRASTSLNFGYNFTTAQSENLVNNSLFPVKNISSLFSAKIENATFNWLVASYEVSYNISKRAGNSVNNRSRFLGQSVKLVISPGKEGSFIGSYDATYYTIGKQNFFNKFLDASYRYTFGKRKTDVELKWMNVLNTKEFKQVVISTVETNITRFTLRPAQFLLSVRTNLRR
ncbi:MAG: hypothetical protein ABI237_07515 [Ginsengibacter sp.]